jgi:hypothetical protein
VGSIEGFQLQKLAKVSFGRNNNPFILLLSMNLQLRLNSFLKRMAGIMFFLSFMNTFAQTGNVVLVEEFSETGCGACAEYDSAFQALTDKKAEKVAVISYHCFYSLDTFFTYNKAGDQRYSFYQIRSGFPSAMINGKKPGETSHLYFVNAPLIDTMYKEPPQFILEVKCVRSEKNKVKGAVLSIKATTLKDNPSKDLRLFVVATENNINYKEKYHTSAPNGLNNFNHIMRAILPDTNGMVISPLTKGKVNKAKVSYTNDDREINFKEVEFVVFVQNVATKEVLGATVVKEVR